MNNVTSQRNERSPQDELAEEQSEVMEQSVANKNDAFSLKNGNPLDLVSIWTTAVAIHVNSSFMNTKFSFLKSSVSDNFDS